MILELGSCFVEGSGEDLIKVLFGMAKDVLEVSQSRVAADSVISITTLPHNNVSFMLVDDSWSWSS